MLPFPLNTAQLPAMAKQVLSAPSTLTNAGTFTAELTGLTPNQTYHFRAKAVGNGATYGNDQSFTTSTSAPVVATGAARNITSTGATLEGNLTAIGE